MPVPYKADNVRAVIPYLVVRDSERALRFLHDVFDAQEIHITRDPARARIVHATLSIGDGTLMLGQAHGEFQPQPASVYVYVPDVDATYKKALAAGAQSLNAPADMPYGDRGAGVRDAEGISWWMGTQVEELSPAEIDRRMQEEMRRRSGQ